VRQSPDGNEKNFEAEVTSEGAVSFEDDFLRAGSQYRSHSDADAIMIDGRNGSIMPLKKDCSGSDQRWKASKRGFDDYHEKTGFSWRA
jgi:hypothetical protein